MSIEKQAEPAGDLHELNGAATAPRPAPASSERKIAANQANGRKSRGPVTPEGKKRVGQNARKFPVRLLGLAEAKVLNQEPGAAERLYRELIAPYEPAPPILAMHFQDMARQRLELEAWERIRDAWLEDRWQQNDIKRRRRFFEMEREQPLSLKQRAEEGIESRPDSAAKFKEQMDNLGALKQKLAKREFDAGLGLLLRNLYGKDLDAKYPRSQTICMRCERLMDPAGSHPLSEGEFEGLLDLLEAEEQRAITAYGLELDEKTMTRAACMGRLSSARDDLWMNLQGERLRQAIDRKQWVITGLLQALGLTRRPNEAPATKAKGKKGNGAAAGGAGNGQATRS